MKRLCLTLVALGLVCLPVATGRTQQPAAPAEGASTAPHQIGLIDMAHVFNKYEKFNAQKESLQNEIEQTDLQAREMIEQMKGWQNQLASGNLQEGSPEYVKLESQLLEAQTRLESFRRNSQRDFLRKEAEIYKTIYLEVEDAVSRYSRYFNYTLVLRFNRQKVDEADNPRDIINGMNRQVVYHRNQDDLTDPILNYLNEEWRKRSGGAPSSGGATPASGTATPRPSAGREPANPTR